MKPEIFFIVRYQGDDILGLQCISAVLKRAGYSVKLLNSLRRGQIESAFKEQKSLKIVAYSSTTGFFPYYYSLNKKLKERFDFFSVFGGPHAMAVPEIVELDGIDAVCLGEGEYAFLELANKLNSRQDYKRTKNFWIKQEGRIYKNNLNPPIENLDELPFPDRDLFKDCRLFNPEKIIVMTTRGCPYSCAYCSNSFYNKRYKAIGSALFRRRSVNNVIDEILAYKAGHDLKFVWFKDDVFISSESWLEEFARAYKREVNVPFHCLVRLDLMTENIATMLANAGCYSVVGGIETYNSDIRERILKRKMDNEQIVTAIKIIQNKKIKILTTNIVGIPGGTLKDDIDTLRFNADNKIKHADCSFLTVHPKTMMEEFLAKPDICFKERELDYYLNCRSEIKKIHYLFSLLVKFPGLIKHTEYLVSLPLRYIYHLIYVVTISFDSYFTSYPLTRRSLFQLLRKVFVKCLPK